MKKIIRKLLVSALAVAMAVLILPNAKHNVHAAGTLTTGVSDLTAAWTDASNSSGSASWSVDASRKIIGTAKGYASLGVFKKTITTTLTFTNGKSSSAILSFDCSLSGGGSVDVPTGSNSYTLAAGGTVVITLTSPSGTNTNTLTISNLNLEEVSSITTTFKAPENGSYKVDGESISSETQKTQLSSEAYSVEATANSGYTFLGWYNETTNSYISYSATDILTISKNSTIVPKFVSNSTAMFGVASAKFVDLNEAGQYAVSSGNSKIILLNSGTLSKGEYTIPAGITLLVPFDAANTCYTTEPETVGITGSIFGMGGSTNAYVTPTAYKTLTLADGVSINVDGAISVSAKHAYAEGSKIHGAAPSGACGFIKMNDNSEVIIKDGGALYAWGFVIGDGEVIAKSGGTIYEYFQIADFRGGTATDAIVGESGAYKVFPLSQYYVQNVEVKEVIEHNADVYVYTSVFMGGMGLSSDVKFIGEGAMFVPEEGATLTKSYDPTKDRIHFDVDGNMAINNLTIKLATKSVNSADYVLPINSNYSINIHSGTTTVNQDVALLPGVEIGIDENATLNIAENYKLFIYDSEQWGNYVHANGLTKFQSVIYSPTRSYSRTESDLKDAMIDVNGIVAANGNIYTTTSGADIISNNETGEYVLGGNAPEDTVTYQYVQNATDPFIAINVTSAKLHNEDGSYTETIGSVAGDKYYWNASVDRWMKDGTYAILFDTDGGTELDPIEEAGGAAITKPADPTKEGYTFVGWDVDGDGVYNAEKDIFPTTMPAENKTIAAIWQINQYTITFNSDGGSAVTAITQNYNTALTAPDEPTKTGYTFQGWDSTGDGAVDTFPATMPAKDLILKAVWKINQYTITFNTAGGTEIKAITADYNSAITAPADPTKEGHTFAGWDKTIPTTMPAENMTITAKWTVNQYTITFDTEGGSTIAAITQDYGTAITKPADPTKVGYTFAGWDKEIPGKMPAGDMTITASWTINTHTITFNTNGGTTIEPITQNYGTTIIPPADPTKIGYTFKEWDADIPPVMPDMDLTVNAQWTINQYSITFDAYGGQWADGSSSKTITQDYATTVTKPADPTKEGYTFVGWDVEVPGAMPAEDMTITAQWTINQYSITFDADGGQWADGSNRKTITQDYATTVTKPADPTKEGYTFTGWDTEIPSTMPVDGMTITAQWKVNQYTVSFVVDGKECSSTTQDYGTEIKKPEDPTKEGWTFSGWRIVDSEDFMPLTLPAKDLTVEAVWTVNEHTITFVDYDGTVIDSITADYGTELTVPTDLTREGYEFAGWDKTIPTTMPDENLTIQAKWNVLQYTIKFVTDSEEEPYATITEDYGTSITAPADPEKTGHTFAGWDTEIPTTMPAKDMTITATWNINAYTITFNSNGGSDVASITANYGDDITEPVKPTKEGYSFEGWDLVVEGEGDGEVDTFPATMPVDGATYVAIWSVNTYSITFDTNGGSAIETMFVKYGEAVTKPADPTREGYTFAGWNGTIPTTMPAENLKFTAKWKINSYTITFDTDGGSEVEAISADYGTAVDVPEAPTKTGYTFLGWDINGDGEYDAETDVFPATMPGKDITITAIWQVKQYTITFNTAGGTTIAAITQDYGSDITAPEDPTKTGYAFAGWDKEIPETMPAENVTITANWTIKQYTITFDTDGGTVVAPITQDYNTAVTAPANPTKEGYTFAGWDKTIPTTMPAENVTITAQWTIEQYTITFDANGGKWSDDVTSKVSEQDYDTEITVPEAPTREGYTFTGWDIEVPEKMPANNVTVKAQWKINTYTVTWAGADGTTLETDENVEYGTTPKYDGDMPEKEQTADYYYVFKGWTPAISAVKGDITYTAEFTEVARDKFVITFDTDGGSKVDSIILAAGEAVTAPAAPEKEGYTFAGWDKDIPETMPAENVTITAQWTPIEYTITFNTDGGSKVDAITQGYETAVTAPANPTKEGYTFAGWSPAFPATMPLGGLEVTAQWQINQYTITFNTDGGSAVAPIKQNYGTEIKAPADPTKTGYIFDGWDAEIPATMPASNMTITAKWKVNNYTITFDTDGGSEVASIEAAYGSTIKKPADPTKEGYTFAGWDVEIPATMPASDMTIKALWNVNQYTITFVTGGGSNVAPIKQNYGTEVTAPADPTRTGYTFAGWDKEVPAKMPAGDMTITAQWTANKYTATFDTDGGDVVAPIEAAYGSVIETPADPTKEGYTFAGWDLDNDKEADTLPETMPLNGFTAKALWNVNQYTITFDSDGGTEVASITQNYGTGIATPKAPEKEGYTFKGWLPELPTTMPAKDMKLTAQWQINQYTITFDTDGGNEIAPITQNYNTPVNVPSDPVKTGYTFKGWDVKVPETMPAADMTITAIWEINKYTVSWDVNSDGVIDDKDVTEEVTYGTTPKYEGETPVKEADAQYTYTFAGWTPEISEATQNIVYTPVFEKTVNLYEIGWDIDDDGKVEETTKVAYDSMPTPPAPEKANDEKYTYEFTGWDPEIEAVTGEAVYTAKFDSTPVDYTIVFDTDGGTAIESITAGYGTKIEVADPTKTGYTFAGWDIDGDDKADGLPETMPVDGVKATALWTVNQYTITFVTDGGTEIASITDDFGAAVKAPENPTKTGYTFAGWDIAIPETMPAEDMTITAQWTINQYTITFDTDGGSEVKAITADYGTKVTAPENPTKEGYTFKGWSADVPATMPAENVTLTAKWEINKYTVTFIVNGEEIEVTQDYGTEIELPEEPTKEGYNFNGWKLVDTEDDEIVMMPTTIPAGDIKVEPYWTIGQYTINYIDTDGTSIYFETLDFDSEIKAPEDPEKTGYTFLGWDIDGDDKADEIPATMPAENVTATALWKINQYTITFDTNGGSKVAAITADYAEAVTVPENPTKEGHTFAGWDKEIPATMPAENMTITAKWTVNEYTITFNTNGGSKVDSITANYGEAVTEPAAPTKEGYTFTGWDAEFPETMPAGGLTLTAQWSLNSYAIGWDVDGDGKEDDWTTVDYGVTPEHEDGAKAATAEYTYVFKGWSPEIAPVKDTITYAAQFEAVPNEYTITFDTDGGSKVKAVTYAYGDEVATPDEPTKDGCTFAGWSPEIPETMPAENVTVTAQWTANTYTITFDTDGGSEVAPITGVYGTAVAEPEAPVKEGYTFAGWNRDFPETMPSRDITLKAQWTINQYTITLDANGGAWSDGEITKTITQDYGTDVLSPVAPTLSGYTFKGWSPKLPDEMPAQNITLTAQWEYSYTGWLTDENGTTYLKNGKIAFYDEFGEIKSNFYYFDENGYVVKGMYTVNNGDTCIFDKETGVWQIEMNDIYQEDGETYWVENGVVTKGAGLKRVVRSDKDGEINYFYFGEDGKAVKDTTLNLDTEEMTKGMLPEWSYTFDEEGVILHDDDTTKNGIVKDQGVKYYYIDGIKVYMGLFKSGDYYYYANTDGKLHTSGTYYCSRMNGLLSAGFYKFDSVGRIVFSGQTYPAEDSDVIRIAGATRYETSFGIADELKSTLGVEKFDSVIIACGTNFADALSGSYLAAKLDAPILMYNTKKDNCAALYDYINKNMNANGTVYILGGTAAVSDKVDTALARFNIVRLGGKDRYETNLLILKEAGVTNEDILVCTGKNFADSLSASAAARPILLVKNSLSAEQKAFLASLNGNKLYILGGEEAVSKSIANEVKAYGAITRIGGATRYETSVLIAKEFFSNPKYAVLAYAENFPDGLCGGPLAINTNGPLILTKTGKEAAATEYVTGNYITSGAVLGGEILISDNAAKKVFGLGADSAIVNR